MTYPKNIKEIKAETIESVIILKGDKAIEKYGDKGKNGVVLITTKKVDKTGTTENIENSGSGNTQNIQSQTQRHQCWR